MLLPLCGLHAQVVTDSLVQVTDTVPAVEIVYEQPDTLQDSTLVVLPNDTLVVLSSDTLEALPADTLSTQPQDTVATDTLRRQAPRPTLPALMRPYFVLKLVREPASQVFRLDTVSMAYERILGVLDYLNDPATPERYIRLQPDYHRLFLPFTYFERPMARISRVSWRSSDGDVLKAAMPCPLQIDTGPYTRRRRVDEAVDRALLSAYVRHLYLVRFTEKEIEAGPSYRDNIEKEEKSRPSVLKLFASESMSYVKPEDAEVVIHKPNWWVTGGSGSIQFSQSHISKNWYNGG